MKAGVRYGKLFQKLDLKKAFIGGLIAWTRKENAGQVFRYSLTTWKSE
jgi:hypothetical protein